MGDRLIWVFGVLSLVFLVIIISSHSVYRYRYSLNEQKEKAWVIANTISKSLELPMLKGEMEKVQEMLVTVGELKNLKRIHLTDDAGVIRYSSETSRIGTITGSGAIQEALDKKKEVDHFEIRDSDHIFSLALPIPNEPRCYSCHNAAKEILGVLRIGIDWAPIQKSLTKVLHRDILVSLVFYAFILILSFLFQRLYNNAQQSYIHLRQAQEQLVKTEKMAAIGQMAAAISHDLRNPLTGIKMATYYLGSKLDKREKEISSILKDIELEIDYASNVVTNILTYSRPIELVYTRADINKVIEDTMRFASLQGRDANIRLVKEYDRTIPRILIDSKQIKQAFINLISNSIQAMPQGGQLTIRTQLGDSDIQISIHDTGSGIEKNIIEHIFTPFFTTRAKGVGLGLCIVNNIVQKHGGHIDVLSEKGKGTVFTIYLPLRDQKEKGKKSKNG